MNTQLHLQPSLSMVFVAFHQLTTYNASDYAMLHVKCIIALFKQFLKYEQWTVQHIVMWRLFKVQKENIHIQNIKQNPTNKRSQSNSDHILIWYLMNSWLHFTFVHCVSIGLLYDFVWTS